MEGTMKKLLLLVAMMVVATSVVAQADEYDEYVELLKQDIRLSKAMIVEAVLDLDEAQAERFWPVYQGYDKSVSKLNDKALKLIEVYSLAYWNMDPQLAEDLMKKWLELRIAREYLRQEYLRKMAFAVDKTTAARFMQIDLRLSMLMELQAAVELPLVE